MGSKTLENISKTIRDQKHAKLRELAKQQGVKPIRSIEDLYGDFWPEEESIDEFLEWLRELRHSDKPRRLPE
jgi:erythromycin esterase-like protein